MGEGQTISSFIYLPTWSGAFGDVWSRQRRRAPRVSPLIQSDSDSLINRQWIVRLEDPVWSLSHPPGTSSSTT